MNRDHFTLTPPDIREIRHFHLFCGLGGGAKGFNKAQPRVGNMVGNYEMVRCGKKAAGRLLDCVLHDGYPGGAA